MFYRDPCVASEIKSVGSKLDRIMVRPVGTKLILGELKRGASEARKDGGPEACPRENFS